MTYTPTPAEFLAQRDPEELEEDLPDPLDSIAESLRQLVELGLVEEVVEIIKPSTSKLANTVRAAVDRYSGAGVEPAAEPEDTEDQPAEPASTSGAVQCPACQRYFGDQGLLARHICTAVPAHDAPIEDWVAYAATRGLEVDPGRTNRSQIRTQLGIEQPTS